jgi:protein gp37
MGDTTNIPWCDATINFWSGCTKVSAGCVNCYAEVRDRRHMIEKVDHWGPGAPRLKTKSAVNMALRLNKKPWICDSCGKAWASRKWANAPDSSPADNVCCGRSYHRARVFSLSLDDWLDPEVPIVWLTEMLDTIRQCQNLDWLLCTKRPELFQQRVLEAALHAGGWRDGQIFDIPIARTNDPLVEFLGGWSKLELAPKNVWVLTSTENQEQLEKRVPHLLKIPAVVRGLSCEPLLSPLNITGNNEGVVWPWCEANAKGEGINWVIAGGESGPNARPCQVEWLRDIQSQCETAGVAYFCKQFGSKPMGQYFPGLPGSEVRDLHTSGMIRDRKGGDASEWPEGMRVRQWPEVSR